MTTIRPQLMFQEQAGRFATTRDDVTQTVDRIRENGIHDTIQLLVAGKPGRAHMRLWRSYREQVEASGLAYVHLPGGDPR